MIKTKMNKRGTLSDLAIILGSILALAITIIVVNLVWQEYSAELADTIDLTQFPRIQRSMDITTTSSMPMMDRIFMAFVIAAFIGTMVLGFGTRNSPIFIMFIFIFMPILILLAKIMKDVYIEFRGNEVIANAVANSTLTFTEQIMTNLPIVTTAFAIGLSIVLYVIRRQEVI